jgi:hypothetical protein
VGWSLNRIPFATLFYILGQLRCGVKWGGFAAEKSCAPRPAGASPLSRSGPGDSPDLAFRGMVAILPE